MTLGGSSKIGGPHQGKCLVASERRPLGHICDLVEERPFVSPQATGVKRLRQHFRNATICLLAAEMKAFFNTALR